MKGKPSIMIALSKDAVEINFNLLADKLFSLPEIACIKVGELEIHRDGRNEMIKSAVNECYHDSYSDIDLCVVIRLPAEGGVSPDEYVKHVERWGFSPETILGICFIPENSMYRIILKNGMRYDLGFSFVFQENAPAVHLKPLREQESNSDWPIENVNRFWFIQIQALGKLYRNDFLISSHLANMNINETLVQQMVMRDLRYHTNHHRYGHQEELTHLKYTAKCPYKSGNTIFDHIADRIYSAALAYDELASFFYDDHEPRSKDFFAIWECYEEQRNAIETIFP